MADAVLEADYVVLRGVVPQDAVDAVLRLLHRDVLRNGLHPDVLHDWVWGQDWWPHLKDAEEVLALWQYVPAWARTGWKGNVQLLGQFPDDPAAYRQPVEPHVDEPPGPPYWEGGPFAYNTITAVPLTPWHDANGGLRVFPSGRKAEVVLDMQPGDMAILSPDLLHCGGYNATGMPRYGAYLRDVVLA